MKLLDQSAQTNWKFIAIVAFVAVFLAGGILMLIPQFEESTPPLSQQNNSQVDTSGPALSEVEGVYPESIEGWQTYRNDEFGFEMKYPPSYFAKTGWESDCFHASEGASDAPILCISVQNNPEDLTLEEWWSGQISSAGMIRKDNMMIAGFEAQVFDSPPSTFPGREILFMRNDEIYQIFSTTSFEEQILATFRFVE